MRQRGGGGVVEGSRQGEWVGEQQGSGPGKHLVKLAQGLSVRMGVVVGGKGCLQPCSLGAVPWLAGGGGWIYLGVGLVTSLFSKHL